MTQEKGQRNWETAKNGEAGQTDTRMEEEMAKTSAEDAIRKSPQANLYCQPIGRRDSGRWIYV
jgi:hypothetical protein